MTSGGHLTASAAPTFCRLALESLTPSARVVERPGRFAEERNYELWLSGARLLVVKCFNGRPPYYSRWIEVFAVSPRFRLEGRTMEFASSELERKLLELLAGELRGGEVMYVEYGYDWETDALLRRGAPPAVTRLGFLLLQLGFTRLRDWYFPEGFMEGGMKLQGEKPASEEARLRHLRYLAEEVGQALPSLIELEGDPRLGDHAREALRRAELIMESLQHFSVRFITL